MSKTKRVSAVPPKIVQKQRDCVILAKSFSAEFGLVDFWHILDKTCLVGFLENCCFKTTAAVKLKAIEICVLCFRKVEKLRITVNREGIFDNFSKSTGRLNFITAFILNPDSHKLNRKKNVFHVSGRRTIYSNAVESFTRIGFFVKFC